MIRVAVAVALRDRQEVVELELAEGVTAGEAVRASGLAARFPEIDFERAALGIWSRPARASTPLRDGDRVEVYRALDADPKDMRRRRARLKPSPGSRNEP